MAVAVMKMNGALARLAVLLDGCPAGKALLGPERHRDRDTARQVLPAMPAEDFLRQVSGDALSAVVPVKNPVLPIEQTDAVVHAIEDFLKQFSVNKRMRRHIAINGSLCGMNHRCPAVPLSARRGDCENARNSLKRGRRRPIRLALVRRHRNADRPHRVRLRIEHDDSNPIHTRGDLPLIRQSDS